MKVYLLHFSRPYRHAKHYLGSALNVDKRIAQHRSGNCKVRLLQVIKSHGITFEVARVWDGDRSKERRLKGRGLSVLCPICRANRKENHE